MEKLKNNNEQNKTTAINDQIMDLESRLAAIHKKREENGVKTPITNCILSKQIKKLKDQLSKEQQPVQ